MKQERPEGATMMTTIRGMRSMTVVGLLAVLGLAPGAQAQEEKIPLHRVPKAVMKSAKDKFPGAKIKVASQETENGKPSVIALELKHDRQNVDVTFKVDGTVILVETEIPSKELPEGVQRAVEERYPGATVKGAESVKKGPEVKKAADYYQFYLLTAAEKLALVKVDPTGKVLEPEAKRGPRKRDGSATKKSSEDSQDDP
jgi:Putative beta-lactamase-inhibitor-like, PepSY-like